MTDQYTGRARITNKQTGASREGQATGRILGDFWFAEDGVSDTKLYKLADFTIEPILPELPSEPGDTFSAEVTRHGVTARVIVMPSQSGLFLSSPTVAGFEIHKADDIDRATIESVITAKERGL